MTHGKHPAWQWLLGILVFFTLANLALFTWGIGRGLDIKDESFMLMTYRYPALYAQLTTSFHLIVSKLSAPFDFGLLQYRWTGFLWRIVSTAVLAYGLWRWLWEEEVEKEAGTD